jgi:ADP-heptose:LPS heptosyltransferase
MNTTFIINGGAGRVIAAIPALEKFAKLNPTNDFKVLVHGWESLFWSHPLLQQRTFSIGQKGSFDMFIKNNQVVCPEPYYIHGYYNQQLSLAEAFDEEINSTSSHADLEPPALYLSTAEDNAVAKIISENKIARNKSKVVVIQPYGSGIGMSNSKPFDSSHRSIDVDDYLSIIKKINIDTLVVYFGPKEFRHPGDDISINIDAYNPDLRMYMALIKQCDYFVGCDSVGQHMARAFNKSGMVIMGSTDEINVSYPDFFRIYRNNNMKPAYSPIRLSGVDCEFADRLNNNIMKFNTDQIEELANIINRELYE